MDERDLGVFEKKVLELDRRLRLFGLLRESHAFPLLRKDHLQEDLQAATQRLRELSELPLPYAIPPEDGQQEWQPYTRAVVTAWANTMIGEKANPATRSMASMMLAYQQQDAAQFNRELDAYRKGLLDNPAAGFDPKKTDFEAFFNRFQPFLWTAALYLVAFVVMCAGWLGGHEALRRTSLGLILLALVLHTLALAGRIYISGRPPVTNLYSSAVFLGWGCVVLGILLEAIYRLGLGNAVAALTGFVSLLIAHYLSKSGDTFTVLQAVLDTQFWLATHVVCITLGYSTTFIAGFLGMLYILRGIFTPSLSPAIGRQLGRMIYGTLCFAILFSFVGTVLGGLWADDSWGRFWGWDPKENGALMIVLWNALVLHARWDGMVRERGLAALAVVGNITTSWSWFGVNELGAGLHSYGFTDGVALALLVFVASQLLLVGLCLLPLRYWWSVRSAS
jgi:ABC-type transport system involved in cytochrome c biogenesis permease subunit